MGEMAKALAASSEIEWPAGSGQKYQLAAIDNDDIAYLEVWLEERAWASVERASRHMSGERLDRLFAQVSRDVASGVYTHGQPEYVKAVNSKAGQERILWTMFRKGNPDLDPDDAERIAAEIVRAGIEQLADEAQRQAKLAQARADELNRVDDPNAQAP
jgi:hypothetical protein